MFKENKYTKIYFSIIDTAKEKDYGDEYTEKHHIIPRCMGGGNGRNLVALSAREHFICHWLLIYMVDEEVKYKLQFAFYNMCRKSENQQRYNSRSYEYAKKHLLEACKKRKTTKGYKHSEETKELFREQRKNLVVISKDDKVKRVKDDELNVFLEEGWVLGNKVINIGGENNPMYGKKHSPETKRKISEKAKNRENKTKGMRRPWLSERNRKLKGTKKPHLEKIYILTDPSGKEIYIKGITKFCEENNLHPGNLISVANGRLKQYKGWKCRYPSEQELEEVVGRF
jgi:hypothetical protein